MNDSRWKQVEPILRDKLLAGIYSEPGYLLRQPGGGFAAPIVLAWAFGHDGQLLFERTFRKLAPAVLRVPLPVRLSLAAPAYTADTRALEMPVRDYYCQNVYSVMQLSAEYAPSDVRLSQSFEIDVAGCIYEAAGAAALEKETPHEPRP